jgi:hypothetical protein
VPAWIVAESLGRLLAQLNALAPHRSKVSDGGIGDANHATRDSDHNPWYVLDSQPLVTARDFTNDPAGGLDCQRLADALRRARDSRLKYVIWNRRIMSGAGGPSPWVWRSYTGTNPHTKHLHLSVVADQRCRDASPWMLPGMTGGSPSKYPTIRRGDTGEAVKLIQRFLGVVGPGDLGYGQFGPKTEDAVIHYQRMRGLTPDGIVGPMTWAATGL